MVQIYKSIILIVVISVIAVYYCLDYKDKRTFRNGHIVNDTFNSKLLRYLNIFHADINLWNESTPKIPPFYVPETDSSVTMQTAYSTPSISQSSTNVYHGMESHLVRGIGDCVPWVRKNLDLHSTKVVSFPGSGNSLIRYLVLQATGMLLMCVCVCLCVSLSICIGVSVRLSVPASASLWMSCLRVVCARACIVILCSFGIDSNITYSTKHLNFDNSRIYDISKSLYIFLLPSVWW